MRLSKAWIVANKDFSVLKRIKYVLYSLVALPVVFGIVLPAVFIFSLGLQASVSNLPQAALLDAARRITDIGSVYLVLAPAILPSIIASYSFVGEKIEKSLEPLLATPTTDGELLLGKSLASFIPCLGVTYIGEIFFVGILDGWSYINFGVFLLPNLYWSIATFVIIPLACVLSVEANIIISSKVNDIRAAQQLGSFVVLPLVVLALISTTDTALPATTLALIVAGGLAVADIALFSVAKTTFKREEILTKWK